MRDSPDIVLHSRACFESAHLLHLVAVGVSADINDRDFVALYEAPQKLEAPDAEWA